MLILENVDKEVWKKLHKFHYLYQYSNYYTIYKGDSHLFLLFCYSKIIN